MHLYWYRLLALIALMILLLQGSQAIRNGKEINIKEAPWTVGVWVYRENTTDVCTGSILARNFVVTAAQCVWK